MERKEFIKKSTACGVLSLLYLALPEKQLNAQTIGTGAKDTATPANREQITKLLGFVESELDEPVKREIFSKLGYECFYCTNAAPWIKSMTLASLIETVNKGGSSHWERMEYNTEKGVLKVIGRKSPCTCAYAQGPNPPKSFCNSCSVSFMNELFGSLLGKKVRTTVDESVILGGERCSATIELC